jgi:hypothetical protein
MTLHTFSLNFLDDIWTSNNPELLTEDGLEKLRTRVEKSQMISFYYLSGEVV